MKALKDWVVLSVTCVALAVASSAEDGWIDLFDGKTLEGWKANENPGSWQVRDGYIVSMGQPLSHLFFVGDVHGARFKDFELKIDVMTMPGANGGVYFHTEWEDKSFPKAGFEAQINNSYAPDPRKTGSNYALAVNLTPPANDNEWFTMHIVVKGESVTISVDGKVTSQWTQPPGWPGLIQDLYNYPERRIRSGTFALQAHDHKSVVFYKNIRVKPLD